MLVDEYAVRQQQRRLRLLTVAYNAQRSRPNIEVARESMAALPLRDKVSVLVEAVLNDAEPGRSAIMLLGAFVLLAHRMPNVDRLAFADQLRREADRLTTLPRRELH